MNLRGFITHKLEEQTEFVRWWKETVGVRQSPGNNQHSSNADLRSTIPKDDAESLTGITQQQVSKWAKKLQKPDQYRAQLFGAAYILSANVHRRHLNKGQQAMVTAMAKPDGEKGGRGKLSQNRDSFSKTELNAIALARYVLRNNLIPEGQQYPDRCLAIDRRPQSPRGLQDGRSNPHLSSPDHRPHRLHPLRQRPPPPALGARSQDR